MIVFTLPSTDYTPEICLDYPNKNIFFKGECRPENVFNFFADIVAWFNELKNQESNGEKIPVVFYLDYFNSSSAKYFMDIIFLIDDLNKKYNYNLEIVWEYDAEDEDVHEAGLEFEDISGVKFTFRAV